MSTAARSRLRRARQACRLKPCGSVALTCSVSTSATFFSSAPISMWHGAGMRFRRTSTGCCVMLPVVVETRTPTRKLLKGESCEQSRHRPGPRRLLTNENYYTVEPKDLLSLEAGRGGNGVG